MKTIKSILPALAFIFAVGAAFAFQPKSLQSRWEATDANGTGCTSSSLSVSTCYTSGSGNCQVSGKYMFQNSNCSTPFYSSPTK